MSHPSLTTFDLPEGRSPRALILMLHGGKQSGLTPVDGRSASWRRSHAMARAIVPRAHAADVAVWLLRYRVRGWNAHLADGPSPVPDARWALEQASALDVPVVLLGQSMGARTSVHVADDPRVRGVVALAPWFEPGDPVELLRGTALRAAHGRTDKITSARRTRAFCRRAEPVAASVRFTDMGRVGHYMLRRVEQWNDYAAATSLELLDPEREPGRHA